MEIKKYKTANIISETYPIKKRSKIQIQCQQCDTWQKDIFVVVVDKSFKQRDKYICRKCANLNSRKIAIAKMKATCLKKYGTEVASKSDIVKEAHRKTCLEKYGVESTNQLESVKQKKRKTCLEKYGVDNIFLLAEIQTKTKERNKNNPRLLIENIKKIYKVDNISQLPEIKEKIRNSNLLKYGFPYISQVPKFKKKMKKGRQIKGLDIEQLNFLKDRGFSNPEDFGNAIATFLKENKVPANSKLATEMFNSNGTTLIKYLRLSNNDEFIMQDYRSSSKEVALYNFIKSIYPGVILQNDTTILKPKELDIYIPDLNLAFEFNGLIWHSELFNKESDYHYNKYINCLSKGVKLYTIWENDWDSNQDKIKQFITNLLIPKEKIYARKCELETNVDILKYFIKENHLQGLSKSNHYLGLTYKGKVVMACSFGEHHRGKKEIILNRVCFKDVNVIGGLQKILKHSGYNEVFTWSNHCYSPFGEMYKNNDFTKVASLKPDYFYTNGNQAFSKQSRKKSLIKCPMEITEKQFNLDKGFYRIWDCGKTKWKWTNQ